MPAPGSAIGPYTILGRLGAGGMGEVYLARDTRLSREVALKMLPPDFARDVERLARFRREALTLAALNHPNIATIYGFEEPGDGSLALVLERVDGESLAERLRYGPLGYEEALQVSTQIAEALEVAHERGVIHRDLKPGNVMVGPRGLVKVLDFGLAKGAADAAAVPPTPVPAPSATASALDADDEAATLEIGSGGPPASAGTGSQALTELGAVVGTPGYMSPEQVRGQPLDPRSDVFAFGCVLYECLAGARAFPGRSPRAALTATLSGTPEWTQLPERTSPRVRELLEHCLEKDPARRIAGMREARLTLEEVLGTRRASALRAGEVAAATPNNLPKQLSSFVGREHVLEECTKELQGTRLLTLTGVGGCGKTRLALRLAEGLLDPYPDGVWFVDLAPVQSAALVAGTVAVTLGVREEPGRPLIETLAAQLAPRRTLVVLDNCEHVVPACAELAQKLLASCPELVLIATSREPMHVAGEHVYPVPPLGLPSAGKAASTAALAASESVRLFADRAALVAPGFGIDAANAVSVADICRSLDGIPLAIELAAARIRVLAPEEIRTRLSDRFRLLAGRGGLARHQTLGATIQWSYDLLAEPEKQLLRSLSIFGGGWTLGSATAVCMEHGDEFEVLDLLSLLVDKSLVSVDRTLEARTRYRFLETVRAYAADKLGETDDASPLQKRHVGYFLALAETAERKLYGPEQRQWLGELEEEHENLLAAFAACGQMPDGAENGLRLAGSIARFWSARGYFGVGRHTLEEALHRPGAAAPTRARATALVRAAGLALYQGAYDAARPLVEQSLAIYRELGDRKGVARSLSAFGSVATCQGEFAAARGYIEEGLGIYDELGERRGVAVSRHNLGFLDLCEGNLAQAEASYGAALALYREVGDAEYTALTLSALAMASTRSDRLEAARARLVEALQTARELGAQWVAAHVLDAAAELAAAGGERERAVRIAAAAGALRENIEAPLLPVEQNDRDALLARLRLGLGEEAYAEADRQGRQLAFEEAVEDTLRWVAPGSSPSTVEHG